MNKQQLINQIISNMRTEYAEALANEKTAYFKALTNKEFAAADKKVRDLTIKLSQGKATSDELKNAQYGRDKLLSKTFTNKTKTPPCCNGTGYKNGKICPCVKKKYIDILVKQSGFTSSAPKNFNNLLNVFKDEKIKANYKKIYDTLTKYCTAFPTPKNVILCGATGTGKTYAAQIVANNLLSNGFSVLYQTSFSLIQRFKNYIKDFSETGTDLDALFECDLLIIDDLGTEPVIKNITEEYLYNVINERLTQNKPFLITTNLSPDALAARYDQRLASRILSREKSVLIELKSPDLRLS